MQHYLIPFNIKPLYLLLFFNFLIHIYLSKSSCTSFSIFSAKSQKEKEIFVPKEIEPNTTSARLMKSIGFKKTDTDILNITSGIVAIVFILLTFGIIVTMDCVTCKRDINIMKRNLQYFKYSRTPSVDVAED